MTNQWNPDSVFEVLADEKSRQILAATNITPRSAQDLVDLCNGSLSAIYRRVNVLDEYGFLDERQKIDMEGHHHSVYTPNFNELDVELDHNTIVVDLSDTEYAEQWPKVTEQS